MFGRKKMYKKGLADAMSAYKSFGEKQEAAIAYMREEIKAGRQADEALKDMLDSLGDDIDGIYGYLNSNEKKALYHLSTPLDIKDLDDEEQRLLLAVLYQLASDEGTSLTDAQRAFIRSIQRYLEITNPQTTADLSVVGDIDSLDAQRAFFQTVLEFFYLQNGSVLSDTQEDFLGWFSVNRRQAALIKERVKRLLNAVGPEGIAEKYGYVPLDGDALSEGETTSSDSPAEGYRNYVKADDELFYSLFDCSVIGGKIYNFIETENYFVLQAGNPEENLLLVNKSTEEIRRCEELPRSCVLLKSNGSPDTILLIKHYNPELEKKENAFYKLEDEEKIVLPPVKSPLANLFDSRYPYAAYMAKDYSFIYIYNAENDTGINLSVPFGFTHFIPVFWGGDMQYEYIDAQNYIEIKNDIFYCIAQNIPKVKMSGTPDEYVLLGYDLKAKGKLKIQIPFTFPDHFTIKGFCLRDNKAYICGLNTLDGSWCSFGYYPDRTTVLILEINLETKDSWEVFSEAIPCDTLHACFEGSQWFFYGIEPKRDTFGIKAFNFETMTSQVVVSSGMGNKNEDGFRCYCTGGKLIFMDTSGQMCMLDPNDPTQVEVLG